MVDPVTLIILVAAGEAASPTSVAMLRAARDALGGPAVELRETKGEPTDDEVLATEQAERPNAVAELVWDAPDRRRVTVRVHIARTQRWLERSMTYRPSDPGAERGRTLGLAIASILPEVGTQQGPAGPGAPTAPGTPPAPAAAPAPTSTSLPQASAPTTEPASVTTATPETPTTPATATATAAPSAVLGSIGAEGRDTGATAASAPSKRPRVEIDFAASAASSLGGSPDTIGVGAGTQWFLFSSLSLRLAASERSGSLDVAEASVFAFVAASGVVVHPWQSSSPSHPVDVSFRADYLLVRQSATHFDSDDPTPVTQARWLSGVDAFVDGGWLVSSDVAAVVGVGLEDVLAPTYVNVRQKPVATIPPLRALAELGFRLRF